MTNILKLDWQGRSARIIIGPGAGSFLAPGDSRALSISCDTVQELESAVAILKDELDAMLDSFREELAQG